MEYVLGYSRIYNKMNDRGRTCDHLSLIEFFINNNKQVRGMELHWHLRIVRCQKSRVQIHKNRLKLNN